MCNKTQNPILPLLLTVLAGALFLASCSNLEINSDFDVSFKASRAGAAVADADDIVYPPMPRVERPQPQRTVLANGMVVMLLEDRELPLIEARVRIETGGRWEPADKVGLARLTGQVLRSGGTRSTPSDELDDLLEDRAAVIETSIGVDSGTAFLSSLKDDFPEVLEIFADVLRHPAFEEEKLAVAKTQVVAGIARQNDNANQIAGREFRQLIYGEDSPYARQPTYATIDHIGRDDLVAWHGRYFHPDRIILGLVGDFDSQAVLQRIEDVFGAWPSGPAAAEPEIEVTPPAPGIHFAAKNDVNQSYLRIGHLGVRRDDPDYYALEVMNQVLGGSFASRLFSRVRGQQGLAYNVFGSVLSRWDHPGVFQMSMSTKTETTGTGIASLLTEARNMTAEPPTDDEVEKARAAILNSFVFLADSTGEILARQLTYEYFGYPLDWLDRYRQGIDAVTTDQVRAAAAKHIRPDDFVTLVVGPEEGTDRPLSDFGEVQVVDISIPEPEGPAVEVTAEGQKKAAELLAKAVDAFGGGERIDAVKNTETATTMAMTTPQGAMPASAKTVVVYPGPAQPGRLRQELTMPMGTMVTVLDGDSGFQQMGPRSRPLPDSVRAETQRSLRRDPVGLLRRRGTEGFTATAAGSEELDGGSVELVHVRIDGDSVTLGIDPETGHIRSVAYRGNMMGRPGQVREVLSDYREVGGLTLPFAAATTLDGEPMLTVTVGSIVVDGEVDEALFAPPPGP